MLLANGVEQSDVNGADDVSLTNYTTGKLNNTIYNFCRNQIKIASAAAVGDGGGQEETSADVSGMDDQAEAEDIVSHFLIIISGQQPKPLIARISFPTWPCMRKHKNYFQFDECERERFTTTI